MAAREILKRGTGCDGLTGLPTSDSSMSSSPTDYRDDEIIVAEASFYSLSESARDSIDGRYVPALLHGWMLVAPPMVDS